MDETICWECKKATGGCSWSKKKAKPVDGWEADSTIVKGDGYTFPSYLVKQCPEYAQDDKRILPTEKIAEILGVCRTTINKRPKSDTVERLAAKGITARYNYQDKLWYEIRR